MPVTAHSHLQTLGKLLAIAVLTFLYVSTAIANSEGTQTSVGELELRAADQNSSMISALLLETKINGRIDGLITAITVEQQFANPTDQWQHGRYVFPLPPTAAIDSLTIRVGDRIIKGQIQEKKQAKATFEKAKREGKKAGLLEQHRPNLFSVAVANIAPHEKVSAQITFIDQVTFNDDVFSYTLPTTLTPRYVPSLPSLQTTESVVDNSEQRSSAISTSFTNQLQDIKNVTPLQTHDYGDQTVHTFSLGLSLNAGYGLESVRSNSHRLAVDYPSAEQAHIELANGTARLNADLTLEWQTSVGQVPQAQLFEEQTEHGVYSLLMVQAPTSRATSSLPKNVTFIIDSSGSMAGEPMRQAQQALVNGLQFLSPVDRFNIVDFDSQYRPLFGSPQPATPQNLRVATNMVNRLDADGGTEMAGALDFALSESSNQQYANELRQIIFITDGAVYNEQQLFTLINQKLGSARLFTVGIGSAPNSYFMQKAAQFGRGTATMIANLSEVNTRVTQLFKKISTPVLRDITIDWPTDAEVFPSKMPDLYQGEPISVIVKTKKPLKRINLNGTMSGSEWQTQVSRKRHSQPKSQLNDANVRLSVVWARSKIADLMDQLVYSPGSKEPIEQHILALGLQHQLLTKFTSFVAVEQTVSKPKHAKAKDGQVPNLMPKGSTMPMPQTASWADFLLWVGIVFMLIGVFLGWKGVTYEK